MNQTSKEQQELHESLNEFLNNFEEKDEPLMILLEELFKHLCKE